MRILHFSDVHLPFPPGALRSPSMFHPKRLLAWLNFMMRRSAKYARAEQKLNGLCDFLRREPVDYVLYTGDTLNLGLEREYMTAAPRLAEALQLARCGALAVPGNHDYYTPGSIDYYQRYMGGTWPGSDLPAAVTQTGFPLVRFMGETAAAIALNSSVPHWAFWDSSGALDPGELEALRLLLADEQLAGRQHIFLMTHYPFLDSDRLHGLRHVEPLWDILKGHPQIVLLHGHNHKLYSKMVPGLNLPVYCAGSLSKEGAESFWLFEPMGASLNPRRGIWRNARFTLAPPEGDGL